MSGYAAFAIMGCMRGLFNGLDISNLWGAYACVYQHHVGGKMTEKKRLQTMQSPSTRIEQAKIVRTIGARLRQARELCNLSQSAAARRLGYVNSSKLSKIEGATDTNSVPLWLILRAAKAYEVSVDFLFGATDDWEVSARMTQERQVSAWLFDAWEVARRRDMDTLHSFHNRVEAVEETIGLMSASIMEAHAALQRFIELNPHFEDQKGGNRLLHSIEKSKDAAEISKGKMKRFRLDCAASSGACSQMALFAVAANGS